MALSTRLIALVGTSAVAASAAAYFALAPSTPATGSPDGESGAAASEPAAAPKGLIACVAPDGVLHASRAGGECLPGHRELDLEDEEDETCELCDPFEDPKPEDDKRSELERRIDALEKAPYFEVVDKDDRVIFQVGPEGARVFNAKSAPVVELGASAAGGWVTLRSGDSDVSMAATGRNSGLLLREGGVTRMDVSSKAGGPYGLRVSSPTSIIAGIGQSRAGSGAVVIGTPTQVKATLTVGGGRGMVSAITHSGKDGIALTEAKIGGGLIDIALADGNSAVKMGHNGNRYGIVLAGPMLGLPLVPRSGLPGSYFMGCASGDKPACTPSIAAGN